MEIVRKIDFYKKRTFSELFNVTFEFIRYNFKPLMRAILYITGPALLFISIVTIQLFSQVFTIFKDSVLGEVSSVESIVWEIVISVGFLLLISFVGVVLLLSIAKNFMLIYEKNHDKLNDIKFLWSKCKEDFWEISLKYFLSFLVILLPFFILLIPVAFIAIFIPIIGQIIIMFISAFFGMYYVLTLIISLYENINIFSAAGRSFTLLKNAWLSSTGFHFIINLLANIVSVIFLIPLYIIMIVYMLHNVNTNTTPGFDIPPYLVVVISVCFIFFIVFSIILYSFQLIGMSFQYFSLVELKEARGLMSQIETLGQQDTSTRPEENF